MNLRPLGLLPSSLLFVLPGLNFVLLYYAVFPFLLDAGWYYWNAFYLVTLIGFVPLPIIAAVMLLNERRDWTWVDLKTRLRLKPLTKQHWLYIAIGLVVTVGAYVGLLFTVRWVFEYFGTLPLWFMDPELPLQGMYILLFYRIVVITINVVGEEVLWRGVMLPRQELVHGERTWFIHGLQWLCFHSWKPFEWLMLLPTCLYDPWVSQKTQSMTPALVMHAIFNGLGVVALTVAVFS